MFRKVVVDNGDVINASQLTDKHIIVAKRKNSEEEGGMIMKEDGGYILRLKNGGGSSGYHKSILECIHADTQYNYEFYVL